MKVEDRYLVTIEGDHRECRFCPDGSYEHVLNSSWRIDADDPRIEKVRRAGTVVVTSKHTEI